MRSYVINNLRTRYKTIDDAEKAFDIGPDSYQGYKRNSFAHKPSISKQNVTDIPFILTLKHKFHGIGKILHQNYSEIIKDHPHL